MLRLSQALKEINITLNRAIEFLQSKGIEIEARPTSKITEDQYKMLIDEFKIDVEKRKASLKVAESISKEKRALEIAREKIKENRSRKNRGIGFKNFRRFIDFPVLNFSPITYMVGKNNSGKSTMVKALLLVLDYLQNQLDETFSFESNVLEDVNIVTFGRAKNNSRTNLTISYEFYLNEFQFLIEISGNDESTTAQVSVFKVVDLKSNVTIEINYLEGQVKALRNILDDSESLKKESPLVSQLKQAVGKLKEDLEAVKDKKSKKAFQLQIDYQKVLDKLKDARKIKTTNPTKTSKNYNVQYALGAIYGENNVNDDNPLSYIFDRFLYLNDVNAKKTKKEITNLADVVALNTNSSHLNDCINRIVATIENEEYFYIGANPSKQSALFYLRDKKNALSQAIHQFYQLGITKQIDDSEELRFVKKWMDKFDVGYDFNIKFVAGEAYDVRIFESKENVEKDIFSQLADKGMGSLQVMTIILRIAAIIREKKRIQKRNKEFTILIEEPELNLHPNLQSLLTNFFHEVYLKYGFNFIVETHSEYMIRQSQFLGLQQQYFEDDLNENPFKVFYFDKEKGPYEMKYKEDSKFERSFGDGFFDEADSIAMKTYKLNLENRKNG